MGGGVAGRYVRSRPAIEGAIATHLQERFVANCSESKQPTRFSSKGRHCEPTGRRKAPPDDRLREAIHGAEQRDWIASSLRSWEETGVKQDAHHNKTVVARLGRAIQYAVASPFYSWRS